MNHVIIGTAGHVNHGKTCLIKALTGTDTDRLMEEKQRGITIDLGFACLRGPEGIRIGIIDVPGHERFLKNMLAGAGGMDFILLVVAADEGVMPQTQEHLNILSMLGICHGMVVITKMDLAGEGQLAKVLAQVEHLIQGTFLEHAPIAQVSVATGQGMGELKAKILSLTGQMEGKCRKSPFRLWVDRVFSKEGCGTVVTGTLIEGELSARSQVARYPSGQEVKIREIQVHGQPVRRAYAGQRVAVNLAGIKKEDMSRGETLAEAGSLSGSHYIDVSLQVLDQSRHVVKNGSRLRFYHGSEERMARLAILDREELRPGERAYCQLYFAEKIAVKKQDPFIIRFYSPVETIGGGRVVDAHGEKHRRYQKEVLACLRGKELGTEKEQWEIGVMEQGHKGMTLAQISLRCCLDQERGERMLAELEAEGKVVSMGGQIYVHRMVLERLGGKLLKYLRWYHQQHPLKGGIKRSEARKKLGCLADARLADGMIDYLAQCNYIRICDDVISDYRFMPKIGQEDRRLMDNIETIYKSVGFYLVSDDEVEKIFAKQKSYSHVMDVMLSEGRVIRLAEKYCIDRRTFDVALAALKDLGRYGNEILLGAYRERLDTSRKNAMVILEYFDRCGITRKHGEKRIIPVEKIG